MIREAAQNTIDHLKDLLNKKNKIVERYKRKIIEAQQNIGQGKYGYCIKDGCQTNLDKSSHTIEKLIKAAEKVEFEDERHIKLIMELVQQVDKAVALIKDKDGLMNQLGINCRTLKKRSTELNQLLHNNA